jgi:hypothetical protein
MALSDSKAFRVLAWTSGALALASFALRVVLQVSTGHGRDEYISGKGVPWTYGVALVTLAAVAIVLLAAFAAWAWRRARGWLQRRRS